MKLLTFAIVFSIMTSTAFAQSNGHNSSRSNKSSSIAADLSDQTGDYSKEISLADTEEYTKGARELANEVRAMEVRTAYLKASLTIGVFANLLLKEAAKLKCRSLADEKCIDQAIQNAEELTMLKTRHEAAMNSIRNIK
ncbi:MAG: hypothetical protein JNM93_04250 [Bacteriovoracaceae bacterium]|nr:hypothetical protein [Bacteriovoracaceae bacterium]